MVDNKQNNYSEFIKQNKILKATVNGLYRFLVLWIIKDNEGIHGYSIMKELDKFFTLLIKDGAIKKSNPSKIYPILQQMEESNLITGYEEYADGKKVRYYEITEKGEFFIKYIFDRIIFFEGNSQWKMLFEDILSQK